MSGENEAAGVTVASAASTPVATDRDKRRADKCLGCPVCGYARRKQKGILFWFLANVENRICPNARAFHRTYGRRPCEPLPEE